MTKILITGCSRGIGLEWVKQSLQRGWRVYACCRKPEHAEMLQALREAAPQQLSIHRLDVADLSQIQALSFEIKDEIDILINNAGRYGSMSHQFGNVDARDWQDTFKVNTIAPLKLAEAFFHHLKKGDQRVIVNLSSKMGSMADNTSGGSYIYRSTKAALNAVVKSMAHDLRPHGIISVNFHPGWVKTDMGGPNAEISTTQSVERMLSIIDKLGLNDSGNFFDIDGTLIPW